MTAADVYALWAHMSREWSPGTRVIARVPLVGDFDLRADHIHRVFRAGRLPATHRRATADEQAMIAEAIELGAFQLERQPVSGVIGGQSAMGTIASDAYPTRVLYQATGRKLMNFKLEVAS